ncbi:hypothetical protein [Dongia sp.]|uniref:hypothetical protein n=1 Tax=Dongia sp. TaxID=1977262 RepID=UPI0035B0BD79
MSRHDSLDAAMREALAARGMNIPSNQPTKRQGDLADAMRAPMDPQGYQIAVPPDFERDDALEGKARQWFHRAGLPQGAVNGIVQAYCRQLCDAAPSGADPAGLAQAELAQEWGEGYPRKIAAAQSLIEKCGGAEELAELLRGTGLGNDAWLIRTLAAIAEMDPQAGGAQ